jgi:hypothetical protein
LQVADIVEVEVIAPSTATDIIASAVIVDVALAVALPRWTSSPIVVIDDAPATNAPELCTLLAVAVVEDVAVTEELDSSNINSSPTDVKLADTLTVALAIRTLIAEEVIVEATVTVAEASFTSPALEPKVRKP